MSEGSEVRKTFEDSLCRIDELIEGMRAGRDRVKTEFEQEADLILNIIERFSLHRTSSPLATFRRFGIKL